MENPPIVEPRGFFTGQIHHFPIRVYYAETDAAAVVYHSAYLGFAERGRTEMLRLIGIDHAGMHREDGLIFAVRNVEIDYRLPARLDDLLDVRSALVHMGGASLHLVQSVWREGQELVRMTIRLVCIRVAGGAVRIPVTVRNRLKDYLTQGAD